MVAAARRVDLAADPDSGLEVFRRSFEVVDHVTIAVICDFGDVKLVTGIRRIPGESDPARVKDLAPARGIESGAVENERGARTFDYLVDFGVEVVEEGILIVEAFGHGAFI
jgi:hypothetical protein